MNSDHFSSQTQPCALGQLRCFLSSQNPACLSTLSNLPTLKYMCSSVVVGLALPFKKECLPTALASMHRSSGHYYGTAVLAQVGEEPHPLEGQLLRAHNKPACHWHIIEEPLQKLKWRRKGQDPAPASWQPTDGEFPCRVPMVLSPTPQPHLLACIQLCRLRKTLGRGSAPRSPRRL